jgi:hypothetical protein
MAGRVANKMAIATGVKLNRNRPSGVQDQQAATCSAGNSYLNEIDLVHATE